MKKLLVILIACLLALSCFGTLGFAAEEQPELDPTTQRESISADGAAHAPGVWLNAFDEDGNAKGFDYAVFNVAAGMKGLGFPEIYAGKIENDQQATGRFELYKWDTSEKKTLEGTPVFSKDIEFVCDTKDVYIDFETVIPAGQYMLKISQLTGMGDHDAVPAHYMVLPLAELKYSDTTVLFYNSAKFTFFLDFEKNESLTKYYLALDGSDDTINVKPEKTLIARNGDSPHEIAEYAIVTPVIPDGQVLYSVALANSPTWNNNNGDSDVEVSVYKWTGDYDQSLEGREVFYTEVLDHMDNTNLTVVFGKALRYGNRYVIVFTKSNAGKIGYWQGVDTRPEGWEFYEGGSELDYNPSMKVSYAEVGDLGPEPTEAPTAEPTEVPPTEPPTPTPEATQAPAVTEAPKATDAPVATDAGTDAPKATDGGTKDNGGKFPWPVILICAAVVIACVVTIVAVTKKKKK